MFLLKGFSLIMVAGLVSFVILGREPGASGKPTYCGYARDIPFVADLPCEAVDLTIYFVTLVCLVSVVTFAWTGTRRA